LPIPGRESVALYIALGKQPNWNLPAKQRDDHLALRENKIHEANHCPALNSILIYIAHK